MNNSIRKISLDELNQPLERSTKASILDLIKYSSYTWYQNSYALLEFLNCYRSVIYTGFLISYDKSKNIIGFLSYIVSESDSCKNISFPSGGTTAGIGWPVISNSSNKSIEEDLLIELRNHAEKINCKKITITVNNPRVKGAELINRQLVLNKLGYKTIFQSNHFMLVKNWRNQVRKRYARYVRKYSKRFKISILNHETIGDINKVAEEYMKLHIADAGMQVRDLESYIKQVNFVKQNEAFYVVAKNQENGATEGMLLISIINGHCIDNSVATTDFGKEIYVSHVMKDATLNYLEKLNAVSYTLGIDYTYSTTDFTPSKKQLGISYFKDGWCGGNRNYTVISTLDLTL